MTDPTDVPRSLRVAAAYGWRILVVCALLYVILSVVAQLQLVLAALFIALILAALLGPWVRILDKFLPRILAVVLGFLTLLAALVGNLRRRGVYSWPGHLAARRPSQP